MQEVDSRSIDDGGELRIGIELRFPDPPVIALLPVGDQPLEGGKVHAVVGTDTRQLIGPTHMGKPRFEII
jgi:hypothetical protein